MNRLVVGGITALVLSVSTQAAEISRTTYFGLIQGVAIGFFGNVGVGLPTGQTCNGSNVLVLLTSNPHYTEIIAMLLTAETSRNIVKLSLIGTTTTNFGGVNYCTITEAGLGNFPIW